MEINDIITKEELINSYEHRLTVKDLKEFIKKHKLPDGAKIMIQRVEDVYFEENHWGVYLKEGEQSRECRKWNKDIQDEGYLNERPKLKEIKNELKAFTEEQIRESMEQYHPAWSCVYYKDEKDLLFIDLHY